MLLKEEKTEFSGLWLRGIITASNQKSVKPGYHDDRGVVWTNMFHFSLLLTTIPSNTFHLLLLVKRKQK